MSISILNRGVSGGLKPELTVAAPSGSVLTVFKDDVLVSSYTLSSNETSHTFKLNIGTYTIKYTNGSDSETRVIVIDVAMRLYLTFPSIANYTLLYNFGNECTSLTGGWSGESGKNGNYPYYAMTKNSDHFYVNHEASNAWSYNMKTAKTIDFSKYSVMSLGFYYHSIPRSGTSIAFVQLYANDTAYWVSAVDDDDRSHGEESYQGFGTRPVPSTKSQLTLSIATGLAVPVIYGHLKAYVIALGKADDVDTLYSLAGISASSIESLMVDENKLRAIFNNASAVSYMASVCTGEFMLKALDSVLIKGNKFLTVLNDSPYKNMILENAHWARFLKVFDM